MKPNWAYVWEYTYPDTEDRTSTFFPLTVSEFVSYIGFAPEEVDARALEDTKVDRNVTPLVATGIKRVPKMPDFVPPTEEELRAIWRARRDPEVRRLILEIVALRKSLWKIQD
ncbi:hypothetical protein [Burkholderia sp. ABCPW 14]|uniref:hypothetical protein n=1 Tax=Burkholderia sp. ABCPW 14 TaxID=1637860 RepID=UPI000B00D22C|nr:hypothetical protein [Burkholderia sp. ABCPW 14]